MCPHNRNPNLDLNLLTGGKRITITITNQRPHQNGHAPPRKPVLRAFKAVAHLIHSKPLDLTERGSVWRGRQTGGGADGQIGIVA